MILQALNGYYDRLAARGQIPPFGYSREKISFAIVLSEAGKLVDVMPLPGLSKRKFRPRLKEVPRPVKRTSGIKPNFLWDKTAYALGYKNDKDTHSPIPSDIEHSAFKEFHQKLLGHTGDRGLKAVLSFLNTWDPTAYSDLTHAQQMLDSNIVFKLDDEQAFVHERAAARALWKRCLQDSQSSSRKTMCLVTGAELPRARLHDPIKGVNGAQSSGAHIVSFNKDSFSSLKKKQGANAPVSEKAAFGYTAALNKLLAYDSRQKLQIGDATTVFWAEASGSERDAEEAEYLVGHMLSPPTKTDEEETAKVADRLQMIAQGLPLADVAPEIDPDTKFYVLGLAPNASRLSVRFWHASSVGGIFEQIANHWRDMYLIPSNFKTPSLWHLLRETAVGQKAENISPTLGGALMRSILTGMHYPRPLLSAIITRFRSDGEIRPLRIAIVKACIRRAERLINPDQEDILMSLDPSSTNVAYVLGRLFAAYAYAERSYSNPNATIRDKYMGAASANPRRVFPVLMRGYEHNRAALMKSKEKVGAGVRADRAVGEIIERLSGHRDLPATLSLEDQGRFFVGYYHQEQAFYAKAGSDSELPSNSEE